MEQSPRSSTAEQCEVSEDHSSPSCPLGQAISLAREQQQLRIGNILLSFSVLMMSKLTRYHGQGLVEHPAEPEDASLASIWRPPVIQALLGLPRHQRVRVFQGYFGAPTPKPTDLWCLGLSNIQSHLAANRIAWSLPNARAIGKNAQGSWCTTVLKEYPPALCRAFGHCLADTMVQYSVDSSAQVPRELWERCSSMTEFSLYVGPHFAPNG